MGSARSDDARVLIPALRRMADWRGFFIPGIVDQVGPDRVAVFIDWQNTYHCFRDAFHRPGDPGRCGNVRPKAFAELLASKGGPSRIVSQIAIYRGEPDPRRDKRTHAAHLRQRHRWEQECGALLRVRSRALRYPPGRPPSEAQEKGIDVQLAIDAMTMAIAGEYDVAVLVTTDTDLLPVVEGLLGLKERNGRPDVEVVGFSGLSRVLSVSGATVRWIGPRDYAAIQDPTDYNLSAADRRANRLR
jgi:hypothetical protein